MILDILIVLVVAAAMFIGYKRGTIQPLFSLLGFGLTVLLLVDHWSSYSRLLDRHLHSNAVADGLAVVLIALISGVRGVAAGRLRPPDAGHPGRKTACWEWSSAV